MLQILVIITRNPVVRNVFFSHFMNFFLFKWFNIVYVKQFYTSSWIVLFRAGSVQSRTVSSTQVLFKSVCGSVKDTTQSIKKEKWYIICNSTYLFRCLVPEKKRRVLGRLMVTNVISKANRHSILGNPSEDWDKAQNSGKKTVCKETALLNVNFHTSMWTTWTTKHN